MNNEKDLLDRRWVDWYIWQVFVPIGLFIVFWIFNESLHTISYPFQRSFSNGDLLIFSALLLTGIAVELKHFERSHSAANTGIIPNLHAALAQAIPVFFLVACGLIRSDLMMNDYYKMDNIPHRITLYGVLSILSALFSIIFGAFAFWRCTQAILVAANPTSSGSSIKGGSST